MTDNLISLIVICIAIITGLKIIIGFLKFLIKRNDPPEIEETFVDELISEEIYHEFNDTEPYFKRLYKRTWSGGNVEYITSNN